MEEKIINLRVMKISIKKFFFLLFLFLLCQSLYSQIYEKINIEKVNWIPPSPGEAILYIFPDSVTHLISDYLVTKDTQNTVAFIELKKIDKKQYKLIVYETNPYEDDSENNLSILLKSTNRFCLINDKEIPIYFGSDFIFSFFNFVITGSSLHIRFEIDNYFRYRIIEVNHSY